MRGRAFLLLSLTLATTIQAAEVPELSVKYEGGDFFVDARMSLQAPSAAVYRVLADYDRWTLLSRSVVSSKRLSSSDHRHRVRSKTRTCVLFFCGDVDQVQEITERTGSEIVAVTVPGRSNLRQGVVRWQVSADDGRTRVRLTAHLTPDFWIPPWIGPWAINARLREQVIETADNLEKLARALPAGPGR
ncbi:MAG TPA: SRPBCC family protein [Methylococcaceae bacterium]|nr:SRPBCC family protein [Methylococcaceae bacterium]